MAFYAFGTGCTHIPPDWKYFVVNKIGNRAVAMASNNYPTVIATAERYGDSWTEWKNHNFEELWVTERANTGTAGNLNNIVQPGLHKKLINPSSSNSPGFYCYLIVLSYGNGGNITQVAFGYNQTSIAIRYRFDNTWSAWSVK